MTTLDGRAGIVTGASKGIGAAVVGKLCEQGAKIVAVARSAPALESFVARVRDAGGEATAVAADVRSYQDMERVAQTCVDTYGSIDFVVPNAGIVVGGTMSDGDPDAWRDLIETNVLGTAFTIRATLPFMIAAGGGDVVVMASNSGRVTYTGEPMYVTSKWALVGMAGCLRKEALYHGVRVTIIEPGLVDTPMVRASQEGLDELSRCQALLPEDCAAQVAFALSQPAHVNVLEIRSLPLGQDFSD
jgi:NADP-dependent 3-hydroxy acid dehydrogenase YdfG